MMFGSLFFAYGMVRARSSEWPPSDLPSLPLVVPAINSVVLAISSAVLQLVLRALRRGKSRLAGPGLGLTAALGMVFLGLQIKTWRSLFDDGLTPQGGPHASVFYAHLLSALPCSSESWLSRGSARARSPASTRRPAFSPCASGRSTGISSASCGSRCSSPSTSSDLDDQRRRRRTKIKAPSSVRTPGLLPFRFGSPITSIRRCRRPFRYLRRRSVRLAPVATSVMVIRTRRFHRSCCLRLSRLPFRRCSRRANPRRLRRAGSARRRPRTPRSRCRQWMGRGCW